MNRQFAKKCVKKAVIILFWICIWQIVSVRIGNGLIMASPIEVFQAVIRISAADDFFRTIAYSMGRVFLGLFLAVAAGLFCAAGAYCFSFIEELLQPAFVCIKSVPVASFVVLLLIWQGSDTLSVWISFLIAVPIIYTSFLEGLKKTDRQLLELSAVFHMPLWNRIWYIFRPALAAAAVTGMKLAAGMSIKAGAAAEMIGVVSHSFGEKLYLSKIYLNTDELFAWTIIIVLVAFAAEKCILLLTKWFLAIPVFTVNVKEASAAALRGNSENQEIAIAVCDVTKTFGEHVVLKNYNLCLKKGERVGIMSPSGSGKSTLFRLIAGLETPDSGQVCVRGRISAVFQDTLLCEDADAYTNLRLVSGKSADICGLLTGLFGNPVSRKKCRFYSGGMKRLVAAGRALAADYDILLLDEPFASLDDESRRRAAGVISKMAGERTVLLFTHNEEDIRLTGGECRHLEDL